MREFDHLPPELRHWVSHAALPWRARTVQAAYDRALAQTGCTTDAIAALDRLQQKLVAKDASRVWGHGHPDAAEVEGTIRG